MKKAIYRIIILIVLLPVIFISAQADTAVYNDPDSKAFIKDYNHAFSENTTLSYYRVMDVAEVKRMREAVGQKRDMIALFGINVSSDGVNIDKSSHPVDIFLPPLDEFTDEVMKFAVMTANDEVISVKTRFEDGFFVITTTTFGTLIVYTGEKFLSKLQLLEIAADNNAARNMLWIVIAIITGGGALTGLIIYRKRRLEHVR